MRFIFITKNKDFYEQSKVLLEIKESIHLRSPDDIVRVTISADDIFFNDLESYDESICALENIRNRAKVISFYNKNRDPDYPFERHCNTIFLPRPYDFEDIKEVVSLLSVPLPPEEDANISLIGSSNIMEEVRKKIKKYSTTDYSIHFAGNTGTGKNIGARRLHHLSKKKANLVYVNCGSLFNTGLIESSFFGHAKGSYTGSSTARSGFLKNADKSTLFLDEIENMSLPLQELLLDTIDSGKYRTVGADKESSSDFRIITASNIPLDYLLKTGKLRYDFFYRIANRVIEMPDLKDHKEDIPELIQDFEKRNNIIRYRIRDYKDLMDREWKGNVRELYKEISLIHELNEEKYCYIAQDNPIYMI